MTGTRLATALRLRSLRALLVLVVLACSTIPLAGLGVVAWQRSEGVAGEVKDLAAETQRATEDIVRRVEAIQSDTAGAAASIAGIAAVVEQVNDFQQTIASAVEEQSATTAEMSRNVAEAASGTGGVRADVRSVTEAARSTAGSTQSTRETAAALATVTDELRELVARFQLP